MTREDITLTPLGNATMVMLAGIAHVVEVMSTNRMEGVDSLGARFVVDIDGPRINVSVDCSAIKAGPESPDSFDFDSLPPFMD